MTLRLTLVLAMLGGCPTPDTDAPIDSGADTDTDTAAGTCDDLQARAIDLVHTYQACTTAVGCELVDLYDIAGADNCFGAFQCHNAFAADADLAAMADEAAALVEEHAALACTGCVEADCDDPTAYEARCNEATGSCEAVERAR